MPNDKPETTPGGDHVPMAQQFKVTTFVYECPSCLTTFESERSVHRKIVHCACGQKFWVSK